MKTNSKLEIVIRSKKENAKIFFIKKVHFIWCTSSNTRIKVKLDENIFGVFHSFCGYFFFSLVFGLLMGVKFPRRLFFPIGLNVIVKSKWSYKGNFDLYII